MKFHGFFYFSCPLCEEESIRNEWIAEVDRYEQADTGGGGVGEYESKQSDDG